MPNSESSSRNDNPKVKVSQNTAILIEAARASGLSDDELLRLVINGELEPFQHIAEGELEFSNLIGYAAENPVGLEQAVRQGYQITFNTINGMKYYIGIVFGKFREQDYPNLPDRIEGLTLTQGEAVKLRSSLSPYWIISEIGRNEHDGTVSLSIHLPQEG